MDARIEIIFCANTGNACAESFVVNMH